MKSRVEMMRDALAATRENGHPEFGPLAGGLLGASQESIHARMKWACDTIARPYQNLDPSLFVGFDYPDAIGGPAQDAMPTALIMANGRGSRRVPVIWTAQTAVFDQPDRPAIIVPLAAGDAGERLGDAMESVITRFYDRHQPR